jgi:ribosomal protein L11 methyltransferase
MRRIVWLTARAVAPMTARVAGFAQDQEWVAIRIEAPEAAVDALANFLFEHGAAAVIDDVCFAVGPGSESGGLMEAHVPAGQAAALVGALRAYASAIATLDATLGPVHVDTAPVPSMDWEAVFRAHHRSVAIGTRLLVAPPWDLPESGGREVIVIDPGMAFGTGQHPTTRTCLEELEDLTATRRLESVLDVGTGTGILAAAAARLGVPRVVGIDIDLGALPVARATLIRNDVAHVSLVAGRLAAVRGRYDLVLANLLADALIAEAAALIEHTTPGGWVVASGILEQQVPSVAAAFTPWRVEHIRADGPWRTVRFTGSG